jgi:hypothetical protein
MIGEYSSLGEKKRGMLLIGALLLVFTVLAVVAPVLASRASSRVDSVSFYQKKIRSYEPIGFTLNGRLLSGGFSLGQITYYIKITEVKKFLWWTWEEEVDRTTERSQPTRWGSLPSTVRITADAYMTGLAKGSHTLKFYLIITSPDNSPQSYPLTKVITIS